MKGKGCLQEGKTLQKSIPEKFYKIIKKVLTNEIKYAIIMPERRETNKTREVNG